MYVGKYTQQPHWVSGPGDVFWFGGLLGRKYENGRKDHQMIDYIREYLTCRCEVLFISFQVRTWW